MRNVIVTGGNKGLGLGITVNAVAPGFMDAEMTPGIKNEEREQIVRPSAQKRLVEMEDVANAVESLLSHGAKNITGTVMTVDAESTA
jgi:3-oxoacyl-[acyl-carrier protein] reductase